MATIIHYVAATATFINQDVIPANIAQTLMDILTGTNSTKGVNPASISTIVPAPRCPACTVQLGSDGMTNTIYLQIETDVNTTDAQIITAVTKALVNLAAKNPATGSVWGNIGVVTVLNVAVN